MGYSITCFKYKQIMSKDYKIEIWLRLICKEIESMQNTPEWLCNAQEYWAEHVDNYINGCIDPRLDDFLISDERVNLFIDICQRVNEYLTRFGERIPKEYLNNLCSYQKAFEIMEDNLTGLYLSYGSALMRLLKGEQEKQTEKA